jgi:hypothetical protein
MQSIQSVLKIDNKITKYKAVRGCGVQLYAGGVTSLDYQLRNVRLSIEQLMFIAKVIRLGLTSWLSIAVECYNFVDQYR